MKEAKPIWNRLDEVMGAGMLTTIAVGAMILKYDSNLAAIAVTGIVSLLAAKALQDKRST